MNSYKVYKWGDKVIEDLDAWAKARGEQMVFFRRHRDVPDALTGKVVREEYTGREPESFYDNRLDKDGWISMEVGRMKVKW